MEVYFTKNEKDTKMKNGKNIKNVWIKGKIQC